MSDDAVTTLCAILLRRRMVPDKELRAFARTPGLEDEVRERLALVGFLLARQPGVPYYGVLPDPSHLPSDDRPEVALKLNERGVLCYIWSRLVAPHVWDEVRVPDPWDGDVITKEAMQRDLVPAKIRRVQELQRALTRLTNLDYIKPVRGAPDTYQAGPGLWLGVQHARLAQYLRDEKAWVMTAQRVGVDLTPDGAPEEGADERG